MMKIINGRLTILADNLVEGRPTGLGEHGFSVYLETEKGPDLAEDKENLAVLRSLIK